MKRITTLHIEGETFEVIQHDCGQYCSINHKYLDDKGRLLTSLNGLDMMASDTLTECIERTTNSVKINNLIYGGMSFIDAYKQVYNL